MDPVDIVNASGFPFQVRVENEVMATVDSHGWAVKAREHRCLDLATGDEGFLDLVLGKNSNRIAIECKRLKNARWAFFVQPHDKNLGRGQFLKETKIVIGPGYQPLFEREFASLSIAPSTPASAFCVVVGGRDDRPQLERIAGDLLRRMEALADQESMIPAHPGSDPILYIPVIVTNAELFTVTCDPASIDLSTGEAPKDASVEVVSVLRFTKNLSTRIDTLGRSLEELNAEGDRTVFVVNSTAIVDFLTQLDPWQQ